MTVLRWGILIVVTGLLIFAPQMFTPLLRPLAPIGGPVIYDRASLASLTASHLSLVATPMLPATLIGLALAVLVSRPAGAAFLPLSRTLANIG